MRTPKSVYSGRSLGEGVVVQACRARVATVVTWRASLKFTLRKEGLRRLERSPVRVRIEYILVVVLDLFFVLGYCWICELIDSSNVELMGREGWLAAAYIYCQPGRQTD